MRWFINGRNGVGSRAGTAKLRWSVMRLDTRRQEYQHYEISAQHTWGSGSLSGIDPKWLKICSFVGSWSDKPGHWLLINYSIQSSSHSGNIHIPFGCGWRVGPTQRVCWEMSNNKYWFFYFFKPWFGDFIGGLVVKNLHAGVRDRGSHPGLGIKILHAGWAATKPEGQLSPMCHNYWACAP